MSRLRAAVVGVGYLGRFHAQKYHQLDSSELVGVCDANAEAAEKVAKELSVQAFTDAKELIGKVDAVTIAASTTAHYELGKLFLSEGVHVNIEKPITVNSKQGLELCQLAEKNNLKLQVGHVERFNPAFVAAKEKMAKPLFIECHRLAAFNPRGTDVDVVLDLMIHDLDVILSLVDSEPVNVHAIGTPVLTSATDIANARIEFASGTVANVTASRVSMAGQRKFRVFQGAQYLSLDFGGGEVQLITKTDKKTENGIPAIETESWNLEKGDALLAETKAFIEAIQNDTQPVVTGRDGMRALELAEDILAAIDKQKN